ncbi:hypothetical protein ARTHROSP310_37690 [Arthrobacter sp. AD-310]
MRRRPSAHVCHPGENGIYRATQRAARRRSGLNRWRRSHPAGGWECSARCGDFGEEIHDGNFVAHSLVEAYGERLADAGFPC